MAGYGEAEEVDVLSSDEGDSLETSEIQDSEATNSIVVEHQQNAAEDGNARAPIVLLEVDGDEVTAAELAEVSGEAASAVAPAPEATTVVPRDLPSDTAESMGGGGTDDRTKAVVETVASHQLPPPAAPPPALPAAGREEAAEEDEQGPPASAAQVEIQAAGKRGFYGDTGKRAAVGRALGLSSSSSSTTTSSSSPKAAPAAPAGAEDSDDDDDEEEALEVDLDTAFDGLDDPTPSGLAASTLPPASAPAPTMTAMVSRNPSATGEEEVELDVGAVVAPGLESSGQQQESGKTTDAEADKDAPSSSGTGRLKTRLSSRLSRRGTSSTGSFLASAAHHLSHEHAHHHHWGKGRELHRGRPSWCDLRQPEIRARAGQLMTMGWWRAYGPRGLGNIFLAALLVAWLCLVVVLHTPALDAIIPKRYLFGMTLLSHLGITTGKTLAVVFINGGIIFMGLWHIKNMTFSWRTKVMSDIAVRHSRTLRRLSRRRITDSNRHDLGLRRKSVQKQATRVKSRLQDVREWVESWSHWYDVRFGASGKYFAYLEAALELGQIIIQTLALYQYSQRGHTLAALLLFATVLWANSMSLLLVMDWEGRLWDLSFKKPSAQKKREDIKKRTLHNTHGERFFVDDANRERRGYRGSTMGARANQQGLVVPGSRHHGHSTSADVKKWLGSDRQIRAHGSSVEQAETKDSLKRRLVNLYVLIDLYSEIFFGTFSFFAATLYSSSLGSTTSGTSDWRSAVGTNAVLSTAPEAFFTADDAVTVVSQLLSQNLAMLVAVQRLMDLRAIYIKQQVLTAAGKYKLPRPIRRVKHLKRGVAYPVILLATVLYVVEIASLTHSANQCSRADILDRTGATSTTNISQYLAERPGDAARYYCERPAYPMFTWTSSCECNIWVATEPVRNTTVVEVLRSSQSMEAVLLYRGTIGALGNLGEMTFPPQLRWLHLEDAGISGLGGSGGSGGSSNHHDGGARSVSHDAAASGLPQTLRTLAVPWNKGVTSVAPLSHLKRLQRLQLRGSSVVELAALRGLDRLQQLYVDDTPTDDAESLEAMSGLTMLSASNTGLGNRSSAVLLRLMGGESSDDSSSRVAASGRQTDTQVDLYGSPVCEMTDFRRAAAVMRSEACTRARCAPSCPPLMPLAKHCYRGCEAEACGRTAC